MTNEEKVQEFKKKSMEELRKIMNNPESPESDAIIASMELADKEDELGISVYYSTEEVLEQIFGKSKMVENG